MTYIPRGGGTATLDDLTDVTITAPSDTQVVTYTTGSDVWVGAPVSATASQGANPEYAWDGNAGTEWHNTTYAATWCRADFGSAKAVDKCRIQTAGAMATFKLEWSDNDSTWTQAGADMVIDNSTSDDITITFSVQTHRYWRLYSAASSYVQMNATLSANSGTGWINAAGGGGISQAAADTRYVNVDGDTMTGVLTVPGAVVNGAAGTERGLGIQTGGLTRWVVSANNVAESGSQVGSDFGIHGYLDNGTFLSTPLSIIRSTGAITATGTVTIQPTAASPSLTLAAPAGGYDATITIKGNAGSGTIWFQGPSSLTKFSLMKDTSENFHIKYYNQANGTFIGNALTVDGATGNVIIPSLAFKMPCRVVATANQATLSGTAQTIDGVALSTVGQRVLLTAQTTTSQNGIWTVQSGAWTRPADANVDGSLMDGAFVIVYDGTVYGDSRWVCTATGATPWVPGTDSSTWQRATPRISVQTSAPTNPAVSDLWVDST